MISLNELFDFFKSCRVDLSVSYSTSQGNCYQLQAGSYYEGNVVDLDVFLAHYRDFLKRQDEQKKDIDTLTKSHTQNQNTIAFTQVGLPAGDVRPIAYVDSTQQEMRRRQEIDALRAARNQK